MLKINYQEEKQAFESFSEKNQLILLKQSLREEKVLSIIIKKMKDLDEN